VTFQVVLSEGSNRILFQYQSVGLGPANPASKGGQATVGIRNAGALTSSQQIEWSFNASVIGDSSALQFSPAAKVVGDVNGDGVVNCAAGIVMRLRESEGQAGLTQSGSQR
jgi:hypothetical protein